MITAPQRVVGLKDEQNVSNSKQKLITTAPMREIETYVCLLILAKLLHINTFSTV